MKQLQEKTLGEKNEMQEMETGDFRCVCGHPNEKRGELNKEGIRRHGKCFDLSAITNGKPKLALLLLHGRHTQTNTHTQALTLSLC